MDSTAIIFIIGAYLLGSVSFRHSGQYFGFARSAHGGFWQPWRYECIT